MTYEETVEYISRIPKFAEKHTPEDTRRYLDRLGSPDEGMKILAVAGTNGKGSVSNYLSEILQAGGYSVGLFISPHLVSIRERMLLNGRMIPEEAFRAAFERVLAVTEEDPEQFPHPTFFEFLFLMAMLWYGEKRPDFVVLEAGMGGRLDATNVVRHKEVTVITRIGYDHMQYLGDTIPLIAGEKAGIMRKDTPAVVLTEPSDAFAVFQKKARELGAPLCPVPNEGFTAFDGRSGKYVSDCFSAEMCPDGGIDFSFCYRYGKINGTGQDGTADIIMKEPVPDRETESLKVSALLKTAGVYQPENCALAACAAGALRRNGVRLSEEAISRGLGNAFWMGRMEEVRPGFFVDGGHNCDGIHAFLRSAAAMSVRGGRFLLLFSAVRDKQYREMAAAIAGSGLFTVIAAAPMQNTRSLTGRELEKLLRETREDLGTGVPEMRVLQTTGDACRYLMERKQEGDTVFAVGSLYLVGELKELLSSSPAAFI
jgi:dihydrofolate synthase/folylpolyglutamate synthase